MSGPDEDSTERSTENNPRRSAANGFGIMLATPDLGYLQLVRRAAEGHMNRSDVSTEDAVYQTSRHREHVNI